MQLYAMKYGSWILVSYWPSKLAEKQNEYPGSVEPAEWDVLDTMARDGFTIVVLDDPFEVHATPSGRWSVVETKTGRVKAIEYAKTRATFKAAKLNREAAERSDA